jgi:hypothetical protein
MHAFAFLSEVEWKNSSADSGAWLAFPKGMIVPG